MNKSVIMCTLLACTMALAHAAAQLPVIHPALATTAASSDSSIVIRLTEKKQHFSAATDGYDKDIMSPKSVSYHPDGTKYYVNSLEGCRTVVYDALTHKKLRVIRYVFDEKADSALWEKPSGLYPWRHYTDHLNTFSGKPVESTFSHHGRYLWIPFYRRSFDINAQDPSAVAIVDTKTDSIVRLMETGPLPKMIATSNNGHTVAITHWGNNTVGLVDISSANPHEWYHKRVVTIDYELTLNYPLDSAVNRDSGSGYALRGTVFTPDDKYLLVGCMAGGGIAVIDLTTDQYLGRATGMMSSVRHLAIANNYLYLSINNGGCVQRIRLNDFLTQATTNMKKRLATTQGWETCRVGGGARTISLTPNGRYVLAACNTASALYVVDTKTMKCVCNIAADSYPVGLDISADGHTAIVTSQGRTNGGGNAVDVYHIDYR